MITETGGGLFPSAGWLGVCLLGAGISLLALVFWGLTLRYMPGKTLEPLLTI